jgi:6-phosphogluconolactonase
MKIIYISFAMTLMLSTMHAQKTKLNLLVGTYTNKCDSKGIYVYDFDATTADFKYKNATSAVINPSYLTVAKENNFVYSVNENGKESTVSAFTYMPESGALGFVNKESSQGADPCYIINDTKNVIVANYSGGNIAVFGKNNDGSLTAAKQVVNHKGSSVNSRRQEKPHAHMVYFSPDNKYVLSNDLGTDKLNLYKYNPNSNNKILVASDSVALKAGSGPRHLTFSKNGKFVYVLQELDGNLTVFAYAQGKLKKIQETTILAKDFKGAVGSADIHISPDGLFLYATNRGEANTISIFKVGKDGQLESKGLTSTLGKGPRNFAIDPTGNYLLVAHQYTNEIVIFKRDLVSGVLTDTGKRIDLCSPVCLVFTANK